MLMLPVTAGASVDPASAQNAYMRARLADSEGASGLALASYRQALAADPERREIARRSYSQALLSGDMALALRSATLLEEEGLLSRDGTLLKMSHALVRGDWTNARKLVDQMVDEGNFAFLAPIMRSWITLDEGRYVAPVVEKDDRFASLANRYLDEHMALQALARCDVESAMAAARRALSLRVTDTTGLRLILAAQLVECDARIEALALLPEREARFTKARADIQRGKRNSDLGKPLRARAGFARLLLRMASDLGSDPSTRILAVRLARIASFAAPDRADGHVVLARLLTDTGHAAYGLEEAAKIDSDSWFRDLARAARIDALKQLGNNDGAIALARTMADVPDAEAERHVRLGQLLVEARDFDGAAAAYRRAQARYPEGAVPWALLLFEGSALEQGGRWDEARGVLERAARLAPDEAVVLNYLGYAQISRRQNLPEALELLKRASALKPDDASITDSLGWAHFVTGDAEAAVPVLERAAAAAPADPTINEHLGDALWAAGRHFEARYAWRAAAVVAEGRVAERLAAKKREGMRPKYAAP